MFFPQTVSNNTKKNFLIFLTVSSFDNVEQSIVPNFTRYVVRKIIFLWIICNFQNHSNKETRWG